MKKILFPTDFSDAALNGFKFALKMADDLDATLDVAAIYSITFYAPDEMLPQRIDDLIAEEKHKTEVALRDFIKKATDNFEGEILPIYGAFVPEEIVETARSGNYNLIVMGTKGERNALEKLMGSITTRTMMNAPCPVLAVPKDAEYKGIKHITYASDFQPKDTPALTQLMTFAEQVNAQLNFVHVDTEPNIGEIEDTINVKGYPYKFTNFSIINNDSVEKGLDEFIQKNEVSMLALFIPKRRLWERLFHSSFTKKYTFHTDVPLLVFHE